MPEYNKIIRTPAGADLSALIRIIRSHEQRYEGGRPVGVTFTVTRRDWERGPVACCERNEQAVRTPPTATIKDFVGK